MPVQKMKKYETFALWAADQSTKHKRLISTLRKLVKKTAPNLTESVKWGNSCWLRDDSPVIYLHAEEDHLQFGFFAGAKLSDPNSLLVGSGKFVRHIKVRTAKDIDDTAFSKLIKQAAKR